MIDRRPAAARRWANANASDPFAYSRAMLHVRNGVASHFNQQGQEAFYDATPFHVKRKLPDGQEFFVVVYRDMVRP